MSVLAARIMDGQMRERNAKKQPRAIPDRQRRPLRAHPYYNFPQGRITDHRINLTLYKIDQIMDGDMDETTGALMAEHQAELLAACRRKADGDTGRASGARQPELWQALDLNRAKQG